GELLPERGDPLHRSALKRLLRQLGRAAEADDPRDVLGPGPQTPLMGTAAKERGKLGAPPQDERARAFGTMTLVRRKRGGVRSGREAPRFRARSPPFRRR